MTSAGKVCLFLLVDTVVSMGYSGAIQPYSTMSQVVQSICLEGPEPERAPKAARRANTARVLKKRALCMSLWEGGRRQCGILLIPISVCDNHYHNPIVINIYWLYVMTIIWYGSGVGLESCRGVVGTSLWLQQSQTLVYPDKMSKTLCPITEGTKCS